MTRRPRGRNAAVCMASIADITVIVMTERDKDRAKENGGIESMSHLKYFGVFGVHKHVLSAQRLTELGCGPVDANILSRFSEL
jgi:hypothetical protein